MASYFVGILSILSCDWLGLYPGSGGRFGSLGLSWHNGMSELAMGAIYFIRRCEHSFFEFCNLNVILNKMPSKNLQPRILLSNEVLHTTKSL